MMSKIMCLYLNGAKVAKQPLVIAFFIFNLFSTATWAATHYVTPLGVGSKNGSDWNNAYQGIPSALVRGDTYVIAGGAYSGTYTWDDAESGTTVITIRKASSNATYRDNLIPGWTSAYENNQAVFTGGWIFTRGYYLFDGVTPQTKWTTAGHGFKITSSNPSSTSWLIQAQTTPVSHVTFRNIEIANAGSAYNTEQFGVVVGYNGNSVTYWTFSYCYFHDNQVHIKHTNGANNWIYEYNYFGGNWSSSANHGEVISFWGAANHTYRYNWFNGSTGTGTLIGMGAGNNNTGHVFYGNIFTGTHNGGNGMFGTGDSGLDVNNDNWLIYNNTFVNTNLQFATPVNNAYTQAGWMIKNNLLYNTKVSAMNAMPVGTYNYNYKNNSPGLTAGPNDVTSTEATSILFQDYASKNYQLNTSSKARNAGVGLGSPYNIDVDSVTRGQDGAWDIGAYEFSGGSVTIATTPKLY